MFQNISGRNSSGNHHSHNDGIFFCMNKLKLPTRPCKGSRCDRHSEINLRQEKKSLLHHLSRFSVDAEDFNIQEIRDDYRFEIDSDAFLNTTIIVLNVIAG